MAQAEARSVLPREDRPSARPPRRMGLRLPGVGQRVGHCLDSQLRVVLRVAPVIAVGRRPHFDSWATRSSKSAGKGTSPGSRCSHCPTLSGCAGSKLPRPKPGERDPEEPPARRTEDGRPVPARGASTSSALGRMILLRRPAVWCCSRTSRRTLPSAGVADNPILARCRRGRPRQDDLGWNAPCGTSS